MGSRTCIFLILYKIISTIVAQEFQLTVHSEKNFKGNSTVLNVTGCLSDLQRRTGGVVASVNVSNACAILYSDFGYCFPEGFFIIQQNDPVAFDLTKVRFELYTVSSVSRCNYCPTNSRTPIQAYSFIVSDHKTVSGIVFCLNQGHHWFYNTPKFDNHLNQTNICVQILDEFPIPFIKVGSGCVEFYSSNDCTTSGPEINKFQSIHGVQEWDVQKPVKSFSHYFFHCVPKLKRRYIGVRGIYVEEEEPAFSGIRVSLSSGLRENVYANNIDGGCHEAPTIDLSTVTRVVAKDTCVVLYANTNCNANKMILKPTVLEAIGEKTAAISVPDIYRKLPYVKSYMLCKTLASFEAYHLVLGKTHFFKNYTTTNTIRIFNSPHFREASQILNISDCSSLPNRLKKRSSIDSHGKCLLFFVGDNCTGHYAKLEIGSPVLRNLGLLRSIESYQSIQLCSSNRQLTTELDLHYNFTIKQYESKGYKWAFSSTVNQSAICWEMPYYYRSSRSAYYPAVVINSGCLKLCVGLKCSPFSQHFTVTSANKASTRITVTSITEAGYLSDWGLKYASKFPTPLRSFTSCADLVKHPRIQSAVLRQSINFQYNYPNGTFYILQSGEVSQNTRAYFCRLLPVDLHLKTPSHPMDELSLVYVKNRCIFVFDEEDCTMSENTTLPIILNATNGPLQRNLTENPFWGKPVSFVYTIECDNFTSEYKNLQRIYMVEMERRSAKTSTKSSTTSQEIYIILSATFGTLLAIVLGIVIYFKVKNTQKNKLSSVELDVFYNGSDEPSTSTEDAIQNTAVNKTLEIPSTSFTYVKSDDGNPVVLGSGCFGKVIRGILHTGFDELNNCQLTRNVAIKIPKIGITMEQIRSLLCEIKICAFVEKHENIVEFIGFCMEDIHLGKVSILLDLCENGSLVKFLRDHAIDFQNSWKIEDVKQSSTEGRVGCEKNHYSNNEAFDYSRLLRWCQEIAEGMEFLSSKNVLHADLATRNCLLDTDLQIKITDFGLSRKLYDYGSYIKKSKAKLPWRWMALESLKSFTFSVKTDVWSYGVCLWEIFSFGDTPYPTLTWNEDFIKHLSAGLRLSKPDLCYEYCYELMRKCWHEDHNHRNDFTEIRKAISDFRQEMFGNVVEDDHSGLYAVLE